MLNRQNGQALLIVVLVMVVVLVISLSVVSRSLINLKTSQEQASSQKAWAAAEAGIQQALIGSNLTGNTESNVSYKATAAVVSGASTFLAGSGQTLDPITKDNQVYIWMSPYSDTNQCATPWGGTSLAIYWGNANDNCPGNSTNVAVEVSVISKNGGNYQLDRYAKDFCQRNGFDNNGVTAGSFPVSDGANQVSLKFRWNLPLTANTACIVAVTPLYSNSFIGAVKTNAGDPDLPDQGTNIFSTGTVGNQTQNNSDVVLRRLAEFHNYPQIPAEFFPYTIFSP